VSPPSTSEGIILFVLFVILTLILHFSTGI